MNDEAQVIVGMNRFARFVEEFKQESHRGCAVLVLCVLEESLHDLFRALIVSPEASLKSLAPPGQWRVALENAEALGLLTPNEVQCASQLVKIRNEFAHRPLEQLTFDAPTIKSRVDNLTSPIEGLTHEQPDATPRDRFLFVATMLRLCMWIRVQNVQRTPAPNPMKPATLAPKPPDV